MLKKAAVILCGGLISLSALANNTQIEMKTSLGTVELELFDDQAPVSTSNFKNYVQEGFYKGTVFHRVIPGFMAQGGGFDENMQEKTVKQPIKNESSNGLKNLRGTLAMARTNDPNSARSQFFINLADNAFLNKSDRNAGYAVFGKVIKGMEIVEQMQKVPTTSYGMHQDVPQNPIKILDMQIKATTASKTSK